MTLKVTLDSGKLFHASRSSDQNQKHIVPPTKMNTPAELATALAADAKVRAQCGRTDERKSRRAPMSFETANSR
ncbi:MAG: hypothetical protein ABSE59_11070 [Opitutaceae bacterium]|jgi:hypothetical protein